MFRILFIVCLSFFNIFAVLVPEDGIDSYITEVKSLYKEYIVIEEEQTTEEYSFMVLFGQIAERMAFGIYYVDIGNNTETLVVKVDNKTLNINPNIDRVIDLKAFEVIGTNISFVLKSDSTNEVLVKKEFKILDFEEFSAMSTELINPGENAGSVSDITVITSVTNVFKNFYIILISIITAMSIIMIIAKSRKKGIFDTEYEGDDISIYQEELRKKHDEMGLKSLGVDVVESSSPARRQTDEKEETKEVYAKKLIYEVDEEVVAEIDVSKHLQDKGFVTNYKMISEDEKNSIMIELMLLKNSKKISPEQYKKETTKLWKK